MIFDVIPKALALYAELVSRAILISNVTSFQFATPWALALLVVLPAWWLWRRQFPPAAIVFSRATVLGLGPRPGSWVPFVLFLLRNLTLAALIVALARPQMRGRVEESKTEGIDIVIAFDISSSMLAQDFRPRNRLEVARATVKEFVGMRTGDRIGLVAFSGEALTQVPLTTSYPVVQAALNNINPGQLDDGTAIGEGLATAANRLRDVPGKSRVILLLTDGVNNRGAVEPRAAAKAAQAYGIKIYAIGVGTVGVAPVPVGRNAAGGLRYEMQPVKIDDALLTEIARSTGGRYYRATTGAALRRITAEIDRLERSPVEVRTYVQYTELFRWALAIAILSLLAEFVLMAWRPLLP